MKKIITGITILACIAIIAVIIYILVNPQKKSVQPYSENISGKEKYIYKNSLVCQPCSSVDIIKRAKEIIERPEVLKFRGGRAINTSEARKRYKGCNKITPICYTYNVVEAKQMEKKLIQAVYYHPKCDNVANDARGKTSRNGDPNYIYIKSIERFSSRV